jgi:hypothetical protein
MKEFRFDLKFESIEKGFGGIVLKVNDKLNSENNLICASAFGEHISNELITIINASIFSCLEELVVRGNIEGIDLIEEMNKNPKGISND